MCKTVSFRYESVIQKFFSAPPPPDHKSVPTALIYTTFTGYASKILTDFNSIDQDIIISQVPCADLKSHTNRFISSKWQEHWSSCRDNKLSATLGEWP